MAATTVAGAIKRVSFSQNEGVFQSDGLTELQRRFLHIPNRIIHASEALPTIELILYEPKTYGLNAHLIVILECTFYSFRIILSF